MSTNETVVARASTQSVGASPVGVLWTAVRLVRDWDVAGRFEGALGTLRDVALELGAGRGGMAARLKRARAAREALQQFNRALELAESGLVVRADIDMLEVRLERA